MDAKKLDKDRELSFSIINYLSASYRGKLAGYTLLGQLGHQGFDPDDLTVLQSNTERISEWFNGLLSGETLFASDWEHPETFEAQNAISLLKKLKPDLLELASKAEDALGNPSAITSEVTKWMFAAITRSTYARDIYLRGFISYYQTFNRAEQALRYQEALNSAVAQNQAISNGLAIFQQNNNDLKQLGPEFLATLVASCSDLPGVFKTHVHDINLLISNFTGGINPENLDFSAEESAEWIAAGIPIDKAGYWRAYSLSPDETISWVKSKVFDPGEARAWVLSNFSPELAEPWISNGLNLGIALTWGDAGYTAERALEYLKKRDQPSS